MADGGRPMVFLHIGAPKTGTTYLQQILWQNKEALARAGVCYPAADPDEHFRAAVDLRALAWGGQPHPELEGSWAAVASRAASWPGRSVISNELLAGATAEQIERAATSLASADLHVVYTLRDLARMLPSDWQEQVKHRHTLSWSKYLHDIVDRGVDSELGSWFWGLHDAPPILAKWAAVVGSARVHVITGPRPEAPPEALWHRFAQVLDLDPTSYDLTGPVNVSLGYLQTELLQRVNARVSDSLLDSCYDELVAGVLVADVLRSVQDHSVVRLPAERLPWVIQRSEQVVRTLAAAGYDIVGDLAELNPSLGQPPGTTVELPPGAGLDVAADVVTALLTDIGRLRDALAAARSADAPTGKAAAEARVPPNAPSGETAAEAPVPAPTGPLERAIRRIRPR